MGFGAYRVYGLGLMGFRLSERFRVLGFGLGFGVKAWLECVSVAARLWAGRRFRTVMLAVPEFRSPKPYTLRLSPDVWVFAV